MQHATLQQNGRHNVHDACDDVVFTNIFLKFLLYAGQHIRLIQSCSSDRDIMGRITCKSASDHWTATGPVGCYRPQY